MSAGSTATPQTQVAPIDKGMRLAKGRSSPPAQRSCFQQLGNEEKSNSQLQVPSLRHITLNRVVFRDPCVVQGGWLRALITIWSDRNHRPIAGRTLKLQDDSYPFVRVDELRLYWPDSRGGGKTRWF